MIYLIFSMKSKELIHMKIKVGVIFGGKSVEHEVSIITAVQAMHNLNPEKYDVVPIYINKEGIWFTSKALMEMESYKDMTAISSLAKEVCLIKKNNEFVLQKTKGLFKGVVDTIDIAIPIVHGKGVEDGSLAGYLETIGIPYAGPSMLGASIGQDKVVQKQLLEQAGINVPKYVWFYDNEYLTDEEKVIKEIEKLKYPVIVKPARLGSSIGITFAVNKEELKSAIEEAINYDAKIVVEEVIKNLQEIDCAVMGNHETQLVGELGEVTTIHDFFTFEDKYIGNNKKNESPSKTSNKSSVSGFQIPANLSKELTKEIKEISIKAFKLLNLSGITRFDYLVDKKTKKIYLNEPNTIPGSLAFFFFKPVGKTYPMLLDEMLTQAIKTYKKEQKRTTSFESNILSSYNGSKGNKNKFGNKF